MKKNIKKKNKTKAKTKNSNNVDLDVVLRPLDDDEIESLTLKQAKILLRGEQKIRLYIQKLHKALSALEEEKFCIEEMYIKSKNSIFKKKSEKLSQSDLVDQETEVVDSSQQLDSQKPANDDSSKKPPKKGVRKDGLEKKKPDSHALLLTERYPNATVIDKNIEIDPLPLCKICEHEMVDSDMVEESQVLEVIPTQYIITRHLRHKYRCECCHGSILTTPQIPRIKPGSSYGDSVIIETSIGKYCDLLPIERIVSMAGRLGISGLPQNSLIELTHYMATFLSPIYLLIKTELLNQRIVHSDETTHRMLEGHERRNWYLWGFSSAIACYFEYHDSRSGDCSIELLKDSKCEILVSDVYSGYAKTIRVCNEHRKNQGLPLMTSAYCNAHNRRKFFELVTPTVLSKFILEKYAEIYKIEAKIKTFPSEQKLQERQKLKPIFEEMKLKCESRLESISTQSGEAHAINYFIANYDGLTLFLSDAAIPIDNNQQERLLRNPVIGRKTWYGTHSEDGAKTAAILFTVIETCKLLDINPRDYLNEMRKRILFEKLEPLTPHQWLLSKQVTSN